MNESKTFEISPEMISTGKVDQKDLQQQAKPMKEPRIANPFGNKTQMLRSLAANLPRVKVLNTNGEPIEIIRSYHGQVLLNNGIKTVNHDEFVDKGRRTVEKKVTHKKWYQTKEPMYVDHYKEIKALLRKGGWDAVNQYVASVKNVPVEGRSRRKKEVRTKSPATASDVRRERPSFRMRLAEFWRRLVQLFKPARA